MSEKYAMNLVEKKWQSYWYKNNVFAADSASTRPPFYVLEMFPYPSGTLHMGHARNYAIGDALARFRWANGYEVLHPMGWDACGLPAENAALKHGIHPKTWTYQNAETMKAQFFSLGFSHDWSREFFSCDPSYFRHEQKIFLDFHAQGLAYRKESYVNWDPKEHSVLANEQVVDGRGWRSGALVEKRLLKQWFLKITDFAQELLDDLEPLTQWPEAVRQMQKHWIGRSQGLTLGFPDAHHPEKVLNVFTTRPETLYGATFCAIAWDHAWVQDVLPEYQCAVQALIQECQQKGTSSRIMETQAQKGAFTGLYVSHPLRPGTMLPVIVANYITSDYGTGAIFGCPAHDERDWSLAVTMHLPMISVIQPLESTQCDGPYLGSGVMIASDFLNGLDVDQAHGAIIQHCIEQGKGQAKVLYRLRDWGIGRQRYWGVPIPIIYCAHCGTVPVPEKDLPVILPEDVRFDETGNPLQNHPTWKHVHCPRCGMAAERETDTFDTFFESSWYFARFCDPNNAHQAFSAALAEHWLPVHQYVGGIEHAVMHLLYARFFTKALKKCGYWNITEPFQGLFTQGMVCHKTFRAQDGTWLSPEEVDEKNVRCWDGQPVIVGRSEKMSKSKCNVVGVSEMVATYGADSVRLFVLSDTPPHKDLEWTAEGIEGAWRYVRRLWTMFQNYVDFCLHIDWPIACPENFSENALNIRRLTHQSIVGLEGAMMDYGLNKYVALLREWSNALDRVVISSAENPDDAPINLGKQERFLCQTRVSDLWALRESWTCFIQAIAPIMPHLAEEMGSKLGFHPGIHRMAWPKVDPSLIHNEKFIMAVQINGKNRGTIQVSHTATENDMIAQIRSTPSLHPYTQGQWVRTIVVPGRMVSLVIQS